MLLQHLPQAMHGAGEMCLDAAFRAAHGAGGVRHVQSFQYTQQEGLPLTRRQRFHGCLKRLHRRTLDNLVRGVDLMRIGGGFDGIGGLAVFIALPAEETHDPVAHPAPALAVTHAALKDAIKERGPFLFRALGVAARQLQHGFLDGVERIIGIAQRQLGNAERPTFDSGQKRI